MVLLKKSKRLIFRKYVFSFDFVSKDFLCEQKMVENTNINPAVRKKNVIGVNFDVFTVFFVFRRTCKVSALALLMARSEEISFVWS